MSLIELGKHEQYLAKEKHLREKYEEALEAAARERDYQIRNAQLVYDGEVRTKPFFGFVLWRLILCFLVQVGQIEKDIQLDKKHLKKKMTEALQQRLEELEEVRDKQMRIFV